jgi:hypothetical protein
MSQLFFFPENSRKETEIKRPQEIAVVIHTGENPHSQKSQPDQPDNLLYRRSRWLAVSIRAVSTRGRWFFDGTSSQGRRTKKEERGRNHKPTDHHHNHRVESTRTSWVRIWPRHVLNAFVVSAERLRISQEVHETLHCNLVTPDTLTRVKISTVGHLAFFNNRWAQCSVCDWLKFSAAISSIYP